MSRYIRIVGLCGLALGLVADLVVLIVYPYFFNGLGELLAAPVVIGFLGMLIGALIGLARSRSAASEPRRSRLPRVVVALLVLCLVGYALRAPARHWTVAPKVLLVGLDGASWNVLDPLLEAGELPAIASLEKDGASGNLQSIPPLYSPILWTTIATGVLPERHGITSFYATQEQLRVPRIWELASERGKKVGVFRWWATWPPRPVNGFLIPGILAQDSQTLPPEYSFVNQLRIDRKAGNPIGFGGYLRTGLDFLRCGLRFEDARHIAAGLWRSWRTQDGKIFHHAQRAAEMRLNAAVYGHLLRRFKPDYTSFYDNGIDLLAHYYWHYYEPEKFPNVSAEEAALYGHFIPDHVRLSDEVLGEFLQHVDPSTTVLVVSDHGVKASADGKFMAALPNVELILEDLGLEESFYGIQLADVTFIESTAPGTEERQAALSDLADRLRTYLVVETGKPVFETRVDPTSDRIQVHPLTGDKATDWHVDVDGRTVPLKRWVPFRGVKSGTHHDTGIILARGPMIRPGSRFEGATILDVAPTALYLLGEPVARDLDGKILQGVIDPDYLGRHEVRWVDTFPQLQTGDTELEVTEDKMKALRALGYVN